MAAKKIRAKFTVNQIITHPNGDKQITMVPVVDGSEENKSFSKYTPSGNIQLYVTNLDADFNFGDYYIDFIKAE